MEKRIDLYVAKMATGRFFSISSLRHKTLDFVANITPAAVKSVFKDFGFIFRDKKILN